MSWRQGDQAHGHDNPWSGADISYGLDCQVCSGAWDIDPYNGCLTEKSSYARAHVAWEAANKAEWNLINYLRDLAAQHFATMALKNKKSEHAYLFELGLYTGAYRAYLADRQNSPMHQLVGHFQTNQEFVDKLVADYGNAPTHAALKEVFRKANEAAKLVNRQIVRVKAVR